MTLVNSCINLYQPLAHTIRYLSFSTCLDLVKWDQFSWLPGISWPIAWQRLLLVSAYNEAFAVKHITCAGRHVESRSWRSSKLHGWHLNSAHAISLKNRSLNVYVYIYMCYIKIAQSNYWSQNVIQLLRGEVLRDTFTVNVLLSFELGYWIKVFILNIIFRIRKKDAV